MPMETWRPLKSTHRWTHVCPGAVLLHNNETGVIVDVRAVEGEHRSVWLKALRLDGTRVDLEVTANTDILAAADELLPGEEDLRTITLPAVLWQRRQLYTRARLIGMCAAIVAGALMLSTMQPALLVAAPFVSAGLALIPRALPSGTDELSFLAPDRLGITKDSVLDYALALEDGRLWVPPRAGADRRQLIRERADAIREEYLALREDVAYRIECSALFDPLEPATAEFEEALVAFQDAGDATSTGELDDRACALEVAFNVARANAERLGFSHLPDAARDDARRAQKAVRLAAEAGTDAERRTALTHARQILDSLTIYYLPRLDERLALMPGPAAPPTPGE